MEELQTLQSVNVLGDAVFSGKILATNETNSTSFDTGSIVTSGGMRVSKDIFINGNFNAKGISLLDISGTTLGSHYLTNGVQWNIENKTGSGSTKSMSISEDGVAVNQSTTSTSSTTGALKVAGGISTQDALWARGSIGTQDTSDSSVIMTSSTPFGADTAIKNGIIIDDKSGFVHDISGNLYIGANTKHFGTRTTTSQGGVMEISNISPNPLFDFSVLASGATGNADSTSSFSIEQNGIVKVQRNTESSSITSGSLQVAGGVGVVKNMNVGGTITLRDGLNSGNIRQSGTNMVISATNINLNGDVEISGNVQFTGGTVDLNGETLSTVSSAESVTDYKVLDDCLMHTHAYNSANPSTTKTMLTSSYSLKDYSANTSIALTQNILYLCAVNLVEGQSVKGVFFWSNSTNTTVRTALYGSDGDLRVSLNTNQTITGNTMQYLPLTNSTWTVNATGFYYVGILPTSPSTSIFGTLSNSYVNFGLSPIGGRLTLSAQQMTSQTSMPSSLSGLIGTIWTSRTSAQDNIWVGQCWSPQLRLFVAVGFTGTNRVMTSPDGITWTSRNASVANAWTAVCWSPELGLFCAVSQNSTNCVMTSSNGINWTSGSSTASHFWTSVCWSPELGLFCAVAYTGGNNQVMTSPNGINWTLRTTPGSNDGWRSVCWSPQLGIFCAVSSTGTGNIVMTSPDGISWTARTPASANQWGCVCWSPELGIFCAVGLTGTGNRVMTSPNGINWTSRNAAAENEWWSVCWASEVGLFCAVSGGPGSGNRVMTSPDGINWTSRSSAVNNIWRSISWSPELRIFCSTSFDGTGNRVMTTTYPDALTQVAYVGVYKDGI